MKGNREWALVWIGALATLFQATTLTRCLHAEKPIAIHVNLRKMHRDLIEADLTIPVSSGELKLWYPKWVPGVHGPVGPIHNLAHLEIRTEKGERLAWVRQSKEPYCFHVTVPAKCTQLKVHIKYVCNQTVVESEGADAVRIANCCYFNWNTCLLYPEGRPHDQLHYQASALIPEGWRAASSLRGPPGASTAPGRYEFAPVTLKELVDSPLIAAEHMKVLDLYKDDSAQVRMHIASDKPQTLESLSSSLMSNYFKRMAAESHALFGGWPDSRYDVLLICSDRFEELGLEHLRSSLNISDTSLLSRRDRRGWNAELIPHEVIHAWCGKYRRPAGMVTSNYHDPKDLRLLWIYEGLTEYLGCVIAVRSGLQTLSDLREVLADRIEELRHHKGRRWQTLEDTARVSFLLRDASEHWPSLRRGQDFYEEGALYWLEADALLRSKSGGKANIDEFCKKFFARDPKSPTTKSYTEEDVYRVLGELAPHDWKEFWTSRVRNTSMDLPMKAVERVGYRFTYETTPTSYQVQWEGDSIDERSTIGLLVSTKGEILEVIPDSVGDKAQLDAGMAVLGTNGAIYSPERLRKAVAESTTRGGVELLLRDDQRYRTIQLDYKDGPRYPRLTRDSDRPDVLSQILRPRRLRR